MSINIESFRYSYRRNEFFVEEYGGDRREANEIRNMTEIADEGRGCVCACLCIMYPEIRVDPSVRE